jgi:hypothetical protein
MWRSCTPPAARPPPWSTRPCSGAPSLRTATSPWLLSTRTRRQAAGFRTETAQSGGRNTSREAREGVTVPVLMRLPGAGAGIHGGMGACCVRDFLLSLSPLTDRTAFLGEFDGRGRGLEAVVVVLVRRTGSACPAPPVLTSACHAPVW